MARVPIVVSSDDSSSDEGDDLTVVVDTFGAGFPESATVPLFTPRDCKLRRFSVQRVWSFLIERSFTLLHESV